MSDTARGKFTVSLGLIRDEHFLLNLGCESRLAGHLGNAVAHMVTSSGVETLVAQTGMPAKLIKDGSAS